MYNAPSIITVSTELRNEQEIILHAQFLAALLAGRANSGAGFTSQQSSAAQSTAPQTPPPAPVPATVVADISPDSVERKFRAFIAKHGSADARKLLDKYSAPFLRDVPADRLGEFVEEISK